MSILLCGATVFTTNTTHRCCCCFRQRLGAVMAQPLCSACRLATRSMATQTESGLSLSSTIRADCQNTAKVWHCNSGQPFCAISMCFQLGVCALWASALLVGAHVAAYLQCWHPALGLPAASHACCTMCMRWPEAASVLAQLVATAHAACSSSIR